MSLHRALASDWSRLSPQEYNAWQRLAARTGGLVTLGNAVTMLGAGLVLYGLHQLALGNYFHALFYIAAGRLADVLDGFAADKTHTKSPLGEALDATVDKTLACIVLITLAAYQLAPWWVLLVAALHTVFNITIFAVGQKQGHRLHPSIIGKLATALVWLCLGLYIYRDFLLKQGYTTSGPVWIVATVVFGLFAGSALWSSANYVQTLYYKQTVKS